MRATIPRLRQARLSFDRQTRRPRRPPARSSRGFQIRQWTGCPTQYVLKVLRCRIKTPNIATPMKQAGFPWREHHLGLQLTQTELKIDGLWPEPRKPQPLTWLYRRRQIKRFSWRWVRERRQIRMQRRKEDERRISPWSGFTAAEITNIANAALDYYWR